MRQTQQNKSEQKRKQKSKQTLQITAALEPFTYLQSLIGFTDAKNKIITK